MFVRHNYINFGNKNVFSISFYCINLSFTVSLRTSVESPRFDGFSVVLLLPSSSESGSGPFAPSKSSEYVTLAGLGRGGPLMNKAIITVHAFLIKS